MRYNPDKHHRRSIRLPGWDYTNPGAYFLTLCIKNPEISLGTIINGHMDLNDYGAILREEWLLTPQIRPNISLDEFAIMPNHMHGIIIINASDRESREATPALESEASRVRATRRVAPTMDAAIAAAAIAAAAIAAAAIAAATTATATTATDIPHSEALPPKSFPTGAPPGSIGAIIGQIKSASTKRINAIRKTSGTIWQRDYYEHIIRNEDEFYRIRKYIANNPMKWDEDARRALLFASE